MVSMVSLTLNSHDRVVSNSSMTSEEKYISTMQCAEIDNFELTLQRQIEKWIEAKLSMGSDPLEALDGAYGHLLGRVREIHVKVHKNLFKYEPSSS